MQKIIFHPFIAILITFMVLFFWFSLYRTSSDIRRSTEDTAVLQQDINKLSAQISDLEKQLDEARQPTTKEKIVRNELLMQLPGEKIVKLPDLPPEERRFEVLTDSAPWQEWQELLF